MRHINLTLTLMHIVPAKPEDAGTLTEIAFAAKRIWGYPERWIERWRDELTIRPEFIASHETFVAVDEGRSLGFYALGRKDARLDLLHLWVSPGAIGRGVGRALFLHAVDRTKALGFRELEIESDPNAESFYLQMGARRIGSRISHIDTERRELPILIYEIHRADDGTANSNTAPDFVTRNGDGPHHGKEYKKECQRSMNSDRNSKTIRHFSLARTQLECKMQNTKKERAIRRNRLSLRGRQ